MPDPHGAFIWYELMTTDAAAANGFYASVVPGWSFGERVPVDIDYRMILRSDGGNAGGVMQLDDAMRQNGARPAWLGYVGASDVDRTVADVEARGGSVLMPPWDVPGVGRLAMVADPQGNPFYLMDPEGDEGAVSDVFSPNDEQRVSWNELATSDPDAARSFYGDLFGWTSEEFMPMGEAGEYRFIAHAGTTIGAVYHPQNEGFAGKKDAGWRYYIRVPSVSASAEAVKAGGGQVIMGPHEVPGGDFIIVGQDPQGADFALVGKQ